MVLTQTLHHSERVRMCDKCVISLDIILLPFQIPFIFVMQTLLIESQHNNITDRATFKSLLINFVQT